VVDRELLKLVVGFRRFREKYYLKEDSTFQRLSVSGQSPKTLMIACSDSRVDPAILTSASPGEIFVIRNVANLVPPFEGGVTGLHGVSAAIEFAVVTLKVENIVVLGHRQCSGIRALFESGDGQSSTSFLAAWVSIAASAKKNVVMQNPRADLETLCSLCEQESIVTSIANLKTFPFVVDACQKRSMGILGIYFDLEAGTLSNYDQDAKKFVPLVIA
jgi:carbonic anhydrase